ncbi:MAG: DUF4910 domain-containing protein [Nitrosopumilaceae archaeon]|nr:DUF4910 domain-containing protein [Nitrososphaerota archaeon]NDF35935.1 DUF4910 domain-containing protein [Nitrosopumilaceae archaeon]
MSIDKFEDLRNNANSIGSEMYHLMENLYPICRSITGNGVRQTLTEIKKYIDLQVHEGDERRLWQWSPKVPVDLRRYAPHTRCAHSDEVH